MVLDKSGSFHSAKAESSNTTKRDSPIARDKKRRLVLSAALVLKPRFVRYHLVPVRGECRATVDSVGCTQPFNEY